ncbi:helix-turn-helix domain-containing protein [Paenibacillus spongiae]|uniref:Helix-turn-helix domain-containing protein n=1 Tax=Paenibacillus spongiae TaxID=2909671 RepID=A0ABY5S2T6_9BACL|nr:helix-turn-helix transcriptional regulator [Paenibacillus spongiae]UVI28191.1 helix-turn-helix domain-containing protein [Paenibacillus spongiae]
MLVNYEKLRKMRIDKKIPLHEMAQALGLRTPGGYSRIETGENELKAKHLPAIAEKFGVNLNELNDVIFFQAKFEQSSKLLQIDSA